MPLNSSTAKADLPTLAPVVPAGSTVQLPTLDGAASALAPRVSSTGASRYRIVRAFARGGLGEVFLAHDDELDREVALKEIQTPFADDAESRARFVREGKVTGGLEHPGIVPVYGLGTYVDGRPYYAMRFIKGESLQDAIAHFHKADVPGRDPSERALALRQLLRRFIDVCNAIEYAHSRGVLHRDLKPDNVMLGSYGETLVVDWGLAKTVGQRDGDTGSQEARAIAPAGKGDAVTQMGAVIGTPAYMSPEQAAGNREGLGPASDLYSLGTMLYCLLTGRAPINEPDVLATLVRVQTGEFPRPRRIKRNVPVALEAICLKAMALRPENRYGSARELADDLEHWLADEPVTAHRDSLWERSKRLCRHRPLYAALLGFLAAMDLAVGGIVVTAYMGMSALAFTPVLIFSGLFGAGIGVLFLGQVWWLVGAVAGALLGSRGSRSGGLIGLVIGGLIAWVAIVMPRDIKPLGGKTVPPFALVLVPLAGAALGLLGALLSTTWIKAKKRSLLIPLLGTALGFIAGSLIAVALALAFGAASFELALYGMIVGALVGVALGTILGTFPGNARRAALGMSLGALVGTFLGVMLLIFATNESVFSMRFFTSCLVGGLPGATIGALAFACRGEARKRAVWSGFLGGRIGIAAGTFLIALVVLIGMQTTGAPFLSQTWLALPVLLVPLTIDVGLGFKSRARWDNLLTRATRGAVIGAVLAWSVAVAIWSGNLSKNLANQPPALAGADQTTGTPANPRGFGRIPPANAGLPTKDPFQDLIATQEKLVRENPGNIEHAVALGSFYNIQAKTTLAGREPKKALPQYDKAIATLQDAIDKEPRNPKAREALRDSHSGRAEALILLNRPGEAAADWDRALDLDTWPNHNEFRLQRALALARQGEHAQATKECDALALVKDLSPATLFTLAQVYARSIGALQAGLPMGPALPPADRQKLRERYAERAMALLTEAEAAGYFQTQANRDELKKSTDFESLRSREDFKKLLARLAQPGQRRS